MSRAAQRYPPIKWWEIHHLSTEVSREVGTIHAQHELDDATVRRAAKATRAAKLHRSLGHRVKQLQGDCDSAMADVLLCLANSPEPLMVAEIASRTGLHRTTAAHAVQRLSPEYGNEGGQLVTQGRHDWKRRNAPVCLTPAGVNLVRELLAR